MGEEEEDEEEGKGTCVIIMHTKGSIHEAIRIVV